MDSFLDPVAAVDIEDIDEHFGARFVSDIRCYLLGDPAIVPAMRDKDTIWHPCPPDALEKTAASFRILCCSPSRPPPRRTPHSPCRGTSSTSPPCRPPCRSASPHSPA